jgi:hypothetical protein
MNIIIFGTGSTAKAFIDSLRQDVNIIAFADNDLMKIGSTFEGVKIISPTAIHIYNYDCVVIASQYNKKIYTQLVEIGINTCKIFQFFKFLDLNFNYLKSMFKLYNDNPAYETLITGISYAEVGLNICMLRSKAFSFANRSQDLYYDYKIVDHIITKFGAKNIKYGIIGLCYYSFQYDLSLSSMCDKVSLYFSVLNDFHNYNFYEDLFAEFELNNNFAKKLIRKNENDIFEIIGNQKSLLKNNDLDGIGKKQAYIDSNKNYPQTVTENTAIFKKYLQLLKDNHIKPIVVVFPASKYYTKYFSKIIENEFFSIINNVSKDYSFQYIDYFRSELFVDDDFADVSHLNSKGAEKFTNILNQIIEW